MSKQVRTRHVLAIALLMLTGCEAPRKQESRVLPAAMKNCVHECMTSSFGMFHAKGDSWGTGASSMNGLSQQQIFDRVLAYCQEFYRDEKCCEGDIEVSWSNINTIHGYKFGACK